MQIDISRPTFGAGKHFSSVMHLQGRVLMEADLNEQAEILLHQLRTVIADVIGPAAVPAGAAGFEIKSVVDNGKVVDLLISPGRAYVDGILVENDIGETGDTKTWATYATQPDGYLDLKGSDKLPDGKPLAVYLRVWERAITSEQDPTIREIALGDLAPDTAARSKVIWQVATTTLDAVPTSETQFKNVFATRVAEFGPPTGALAARARRPLDADSDPCHLPPEALYRGPENQLYRVEVHSGGPAWPAAPGRVDDHGLPGATFTWSRENASVVAPIESLNGAVVVLGTLGRDRKLSLEVGDWVEVTDDAAASRVADDRDLSTAYSTRALSQVSAIDYESRTITLSDTQPGDVGTRPELHPLLRRWDHTSPTLYDGDKTSVASDGALPLKEGVWITLEDGVEIKFAAPSANAAGTYRAGDYWMIPARTVTGDVEWPQDANGPMALSPDGVTYHYAALALVKANGDTSFPRKTFKPLT
jgi:hypothetical protein